MCIIETEILCRISAFYIWGNSPQSTEQNEAEYEYSH